MTVGRRAACVLPSAWTTGRSRARSGAPTEPRRCFCTARSVSSRASSPMAHPNRRRCEVSSSALEFEALLRRALAPVDPPADMALRLESTLVGLTELAQEELEAWELSAMRDPRNWVRPAAAAVIGAGAGTALVLLRVRSRHRHRKQQSSNLLELADRTIQDLAEEARRVLPDR